MGGRGHHRSARWLGARMCPLGSMTAALLRRRVRGAGLFARAVHDHRPRRAVPATLNRLRWAADPRDWMDRRVIQDGMHEPGGATSRSSHLDSSERRCGERAVGRGDDDVVGTVVRRDPHVRADHERGPISSGASEVGSAVLLPGKVSAGSPTTPGPRRDRRRPGPSPVPCPANRGSTAASRADPQLPGGARRPVHRCRVQRSR